MAGLFRRRRHRIVAGIVLGLLVIAGGLVGAHAAGILLHDTSKPASVGDALRHFRERGRAPGKLEGVYLYRTLGAESVDALGGAHHRYPATTGMTATSARCGVRLRWESLEQRSMTWVLCSTPRGIELHTLDQVHRFFGLTDRTSYACSGDLLMVPGDRPGTARPFSCRSGGGGEQGRVLVAGHEVLRVGGRKLSAVHVRTVAHVTGRNSGTETVDWWLDRSSTLPLRIVLRSRTSRKVFLGRVHYREDADLRLVSTTPRR